MYVDFEFANKRLSEFGCIMCHINTEAGITEVNIGCNITFNTVKNNHSSIHKITSTTFEETYTTTFEITKNPCNDNDTSMSVDEARAIIKWLNRHDYHKFRTINENDMIPDVWHRGSFNISKITLGEKIIGLKLTFTSNSPYGFADEVRMESNILSKNETFSIWGDSDELDVIYPNVKIVCKSEGDLTIDNLTTGNSLCVKNCVVGESIFMDGEHKVVYSDVRKNYVDFNYSYLDIDTSEYDGVENVYKVSNPCEIVISYYPIRKVGMM